MKILDARAIGPEELHERRKQAVAMSKKGMTCLEIAPLVGAHRNTVGQWLQMWKERGEKALKPSKPGRPKGSGRRLTQNQEREIQRLIRDRFPDQLKLDFALWTREAVRQLVRQRYGIALPIRTVGWYLQRWGFTPQKPVRRAYERNPAAVRQWLEQDYPRLQAAARRQKAEIHWGDEMGLRSDDVNGRGYAPKGKTPTRRAKGTPEKINMISSVTNQGKVRFMFYREKLNARLLIRFFNRLMRSVRRKIFLIIDNLRVHHAAIVRDWVRKHAERLELHFLPSYSPDLNPDEFLNNDVKASIGKRPDSRSKGALALTALREMRAIQKRPSRVKKYFETRTIQYAA